jgi:acetyl-CoA acetyltransferase family protein
VTVQEWSAVREDVEIPLGGYWSTPFAKWQGPFARLHSMRFAAHVAKHEFARRSIDPRAFDRAVLGITIPQWRSFWGAPWLMSMVGAENVSGPTIVQACQTGPRSLVAAILDIGAGAATTALVVTCDRTSNGAFVSYPGDSSRGGVPKTEAWVVENFMEVPDLGYPVVQTAENVAARWQISRSEQDEIALRRYEQYDDATADNRAFHRRFMTLPFAVPDPTFQRVSEVINGDIGVAETSRATVETLAPVMAGGTVTHATQTHPADGAASIIVAEAGRARDMASDPRLRIRVVSFGEARAEPGFMPVAPVAASRVALDRAGLPLAAIDAVKSHNPFIVNDIVFARETGFPVERMNNFGSSLVFGHPQGPTGTRLIIELIEELVLRGGGYGLYHGCAAGDAGFAVVVEVRDRP